ASHHGTEQPHRAYGHRGHDADTYGPSNLAGQELDDRSRRDGLRTGQVPHTADGSLVATERGEPVRDVGNVAVRMQQIEFADEVGALPGEGVGEHPAPERGLGGAYPE